MKPLAGQRVIDLTQNVAGPYCTQVLADLGADVIKIERPGAGDDTRHWAPNIGEAMSPTYATFNRGKRSLAIDLDHPDGQALLASLLRPDDVFVHSLKPGSAEQRGLGYEALAEGRPGLIYCAISAYGTSGPRAAFPGYDPLIQAYSGIMSVNGHEGLPPARVGVSMVDMGTALWSALGIAAAISQRKDSGRGCRIDTSLLETGLAWMTNPIANHSASGKLPRRMGSATAMLMPYEVFQCADGQVFIGCGNDRLFHKLLHGLERSDLAGDARFATNAERVKHRDLVHDTLEAATGRLKVAQIIERLEAQGVPVSPVHDLSQVMQDPQIQAVDMARPLDWDDGPAQPLNAIGTPIRFDGTREFAGHLSARVGADSQALLRAAGMSEARIAQLVHSGAVQI
ncbi:CoA transferase [Alicycliphilus denitrificans]|uniref:Formyl-CoA transferase n=2 Tax=Alicycliphilus denitrificans TaxID=179636 RepID=F4GGL4_ALIDK|nr:CoA transferase [Alicycliphilus denitrificans]ADV01241.1 L-carnitine dehydratase/bile acid-inducible protein F [Alicycliphilus denitrificans BC]AEB86239.1 Formyl-CoA transferase [Alicycliphilus denitrificans K601]QKD45384.1 CoA transferase [Alicycliphilus denitrificans]GAO24866.1 formyl-CoA transferase [Alicycliphilus sp. B1]